MTLSKFLRRNIVTDSPSLPFIHTTRSYNIKNIKESSGLSPVECRHFGDDLVYLFVGRPAYKRPSDGSAADYWELPCCFLFDDIDTSLVRRIFPFDSGAFRDKRYPDYINFMDYREFEVSAIDSPGRIISAFFGDSAKYFKGNPKSKGTYIPN